MIIDESLPNKLVEIKISHESPFANDKLERQEFAQMLNRVVDVYSDTGCVLAINGEWGTGKTTFVKMWLENLSLLKYRTIYFNAWETDYISDPFVALVGELKGLLGDEEEFREKSSKVCKILLFAGKTFIKTKTGIDVDDIVDEIKNDLDDYADQKTTFKDFKETLEKFVASVDEGEKTPVIFVIDELDRCNPHFAVKVLERVKHLFDIPNIIFVLPISKSQLECSIKGFYGSNEIDSANYLRRFIDIEFELPKPPYGNFVDHLFDYHKFQQYFERQTIDKNKIKDNIELFKSFVEKICRCTNTELRTMDKIFVLSRIVAPQIVGDYVSEMDMVFLLCYLKLKHYDFYCQIRNHDFSLQELIKKFELLFPKQLLAENTSLSLDYRTFIFALASLLYAYNKNNLGIIEQNILPDSKNDKMNLQCDIIDNEMLQHALTYEKSSHCNWSSLKALTDRIDLVFIR